MKIIKIIALAISELLLLSGSISGQNHENTGEANDYMNRSSFDQLVRRFESESRLEDQKPEKVIGLLGDISEKTIVDIGAGTGLFSFKLAESAKKVIAADVDERFIELVKYRLDTMSNEKIRSRIEIRKIPFDDPGLKQMEVDGVLLVNTYHHIENRVDYLIKLNKGIKNGGRILIVDFYKDSDYGPSRDHKLAMSVVIDELKAAGFSEINSDIQTLDHQYIVIINK